jgi:hypothetical protein
LTTNGDIVSKLKTLFWWLRRPRLYPELVRLALRKTVAREDHVKVAEEAGRAQTWCEQRGEDARTVLQRICGKGSELDFASRFAAELAGARERVAACPVRMGGGGNIELLYHLAEYSQATRVIETGVAYGWSSLALLLSLHQRPGAVLISTDRPYPGTSSEQHVGCVVPRSLREHWQLLPYADRESLPIAMRRLPVIDLCHYDSDKSRAGRQWAYPKLWAALRPGGVFVSDDIDDDLAFCDFNASLGLEPHVIRTPQENAEKQEKFVGVLVKPRTNG